MMKNVRNLFTLTLEFVIISAVALSASSNTHSESDSLPIGYRPTGIPHIGDSQASSDQTDIEIAYDDGVPEFVYWKTSANSGYSVRFTPPLYPVMLKKAKVYIPAYGENPYAQFAIRVLDHFKNEIIVSDTTVSAQAVPQWVELDLSSHKFIVATGDFYISMVWLEADNPTLGADATLPVDGRSYSSATPGGAFWNELDDDLMVRAVVTDIVPPSALTAQSNHDEEIPLSWLEPRSAEPSTISVSRYTPMRAYSKVNRNEIVGYNIHRRTSRDDPFIQIAFTSTTRYVDTELTNGETYYYAITSVYSDEESVFSREASATPDSGHSIVFFVDDDGTYYNTGTLWGLHQLLENSLYQNNIPYDYWEYYESGAPALDTLNQYSKVIWTTSITGPNLGGTTLSNEDVAHLIDYLILGGKLFLTGMDIGNEIGHTDLFTDYLSATYVSDDAGEGYAGGVTGTAGDSITNGMIMKWGPGDGYWFSGSEFPDVVNPATDTATVIFTYTNNGTNAGLKKTTPTYSTVYLPWNFETIDGDSNRNMLTRRIVDWLDSTAVDSVSPTVIVGPIIKDIRGDHIILEWNTDELTQSMIFYGDTIPYSNFVDDKEYSLTHALELSSLERDQTFHFAIKSIDRSGNYSITDDSTFFTLNHSLIVSNIPDTSFVETETITINLNDYVTDNDLPYDNISWTFSRGDSLIVQIMDGFAQITNIEGWIGHDSILFVARDVVGSSDSDWVNIRVIIAPPDAPTLVSPINGATDVFTSPMFEWGTVLNTTSYYLQVGIDDSFITLVFLDSVITDTIQQVSGLNNNVSYFWRVRAMNDGGIGPWSEAFSFTTSALDVTHQALELPTVYSLKQNYPNPFNPVTTIKYQLPQSGQVNLAVYNISGQLVETFVNEYNNAGYHSVLWNASSVSSGLYFYRIEAGEYTETKKCVILK